MERKLTAILCADVFGYSRLMGEDEEATLRTLSSHRKLIDSLIEQHRGRFVNSAGDSVLAEFASVVNAVQCAVEIQTTLKAENAPLSSERRMEFRIGVNLGDVMVDGEQIYGDGVNVAARLESIAEPGCICVSGTVCEHLGNRLALSYEDLGEQSVKNIAKPVRVYRVLAEPDGVATATRKTQRVASNYWRGSAFSLAGLALIAAVIVVVQHLSLRPPNTTASIPPAQKPGLPLPDIPSIAVLPFTNMSGDRDQEYFSDGITDDLITDLSRLPGLFVIARTSSFAYKGKAVVLHDVGKQLGVKYVLAGGVRKAGNQLRITVQLADATTGEELWAERYDRPMKDVFALQDEIVRGIVKTLNLQLTLRKKGISIPRTTQNLEAYDDVLRGTEYEFSLTKEGNAKARGLFEKAIELDPKYAAAYSLLGSNYFNGWTFLLNPDPHGLELALKLEQQSIGLDDSISSAHGVLALIYMQSGRFSEALAESQRCVALGPNFTLGYSTLAIVLNVTGRPSEAIEAVEKAMRLDPRNQFYFLYNQGLAYTQLGRYEEAIPALKQDLPLTNNVWDHVILAWDYAEIGQNDGARAEAAEVGRRNALNPNPMGYLALAYTMNGVAEPSQALAAVQKGMRLNPPNRGELLLQEGRAYQGLARWEDSIIAYKDSLASGYDTFWSHVGLAVDYVELGHDDAARAEAAEVLRLNPQFYLEKVFPTVGPKGKVLAQQLRWDADLRKAGLR